MKALVLPLNYDHPQRGLLSAFHEVLGPKNVEEFDYMAYVRDAGTTVQSINDHFVKVVHARQPDLVWMQLQDSNVILAETINLARKAAPHTVFVHWTGDFRPEISNYLSRVCKVTDLTLISSIGQIDAFRHAGAERVRYCQIGLDWEEDVLGIPEWTPPFRVPDVVFIGNYYPGGPWSKGTQQRLDAVLALQRSGLDFGVVGAGWPDEVKAVGTCSVKLQHQVWKRAKVAISVSHDNDTESYYSDRLLIALASGTPVVARHFPGFEYEFEDYALSFHDEAALVCLVRTLLADEGERKALGAAGRWFAMKEHSWRSRLIDVMPTIDLIRAEKR